MAALNLLIFKNELDFEFFCLKCNQRKIFSTSLNQNPLPFEIFFKKPNFPNPIYLFQVQIALIFGFYIQMTYLGVTK